VGHQDGHRNPSPPDLPLKGRLEAVTTFVTVCRVAKAYCEDVTRGIPVMTHLVSYEGDIIAASE
jgi:hypothetical protein